MKILIAILSCSRDAENGFNQVVRETWGRHVDGDLRFFMGRNAVVSCEDEILLDAEDGYLDLPYKSRELQRWVTSQGYDFVYKCDTDTYVRPHVLLESNFHEFDYVGVFNGPLGVPNKVPGGWMTRPSGRTGDFFAWPSGGSGYWLSAKASRIVAEANEIDDYAEDRWVGQVLGPFIARGDIRANHDTRYGWGFNPQTFQTEFSSHFGRSIPGQEYRVSWMKQHYEANGRP